MVKYETIMNVIKEEVEKCSDKRYSLMIISNNTEKFMTDLREFLKRYETLNQWRKDVKDFTEQIENPAPITENLETLETLQKEYKTSLEDYEKKIKKLPTGLIEDKPWEVLVQENPNLEKTSKEFTEHCKKYNQDFADKTGRLIYVVDELDKNVKSANLIKSGKPSLKDKQKIISSIEKPYNTVQMIDKHCKKLLKFLEDME